MVTPPILLLASNDNLRYLFEKNDFEVYTPSSIIQRLRDSGVHALDLEHVLLIECRQMVVVHSDGPIPRFIMTGLVVYFITKEPSVEELETLHFSLRKHKLATIHK